VFFDKKVYQRNWNIDRYLEFYLNDLSHVVISYAIELLTPQEKHLIINELATKLKYDMILRWGVYE